ncbi:hypothetical protein EMIHUDRAFT_96198 [Emiliania huxleyi CCMP1516]|uniref:Uncharacterized protein n=2 Tax=Emiliania huxleyi TaxID=2903 RepID=A0A0D3J4Q8_EMIH1|nr:hypothetical protein EMIHUDRAFT_96198 [Emiliania huxleyi CCMP1516]EOD18493.1 hypothetical protein EMIHUDRAFT_96198 [Emiliania huxleyi CCMP1516]|eukprot:XP_005770922.1 hypothetical protein EMIHUDRAFT_96198 [Emiliania huxleyi CCMP1516]
MYGRTLRSDPALQVPAFARGDALKIPAELLRAETLELESRKIFKREHETGPYAAVRKERGAGMIDAPELREAWERLLLPRQSGGILDKPPMYLDVCCAKEAAQELLSTTLGEAVKRRDWQEMWVLLGQIDVALTQLAGFGTGAELPWWVDSTRDDEPGGVDNPLTADATPPAVVKIEQHSPGPSSSGGHKRGVDEADLQVGGGDDDDDDDDEEEKDTDYQRILRSLGPIGQPHESHFSLQVVSKSGLKERKRSLAAQIVKLQEEIAQVDETLEAAHALSDDEMDRVIREQEEQEDPDWVEELDEDDMHDEWHGGMLHGACECDRCTARRLQLSPESSEDEADEAEAKRIDEEDYEDDDNDTDDEDDEAYRLADSLIAHALSYHGLSPSSQDDNLGLSRFHYLRHVNVVETAIDIVRQLGKLDTDLGRKLQKIDTWLNDPA